MAKKKYWNIIRLLLKLGFTVLLIYLVFQKIDIRQVKSVFLQSKPGFIIVALVCYFVSQVISSWRLLGFLQSIGIGAGFGFNLRLYMLGMFYNVFLPGGIGGDGYKIYILRKKFQLPTKKIFLSLLLDRVSGLWAIGFLAVSLTFFLPSFKSIEWWPVVFIAGSILYYFVYRYLFSAYLENLIRAHAKAILVQSLQLLSVFFILLSQDFGGNPSAFLFSFLLSSLATIVPISIGGLGIREYVIVHATAFFNLDQPLAVFTTLCFYVLSTLSALTGAWFVYRSKEFGPPPDEKDAAVIKEDAEKAVHLQQQTP
jgi:uncharacterized membrane protein YbhN (UPF0104 family)